MELYHLKTFVKVADEGNLTRASQALFTSQPAISAQIKALEEEQGVQLFSRTPKGMLLTQSGRQLYEQARLTLNAAEQLKLNASRLREELVGELRVGMHTDYEYLRVGDMYQMISSRHPQLVTHFLQSSSARILHELRHDELDAGFMFGPCRASDMAVTPLGEVGMRIIAPSAWSTEVAGASLADLARLPWVYTTPGCPFYLLFEALFEAGNPLPRQIVWCDNEDAIRTLLRAGVGLSVVRVDDAERAVDEGYGVCWDGAVPSLAINLVMLKQRAQEPALVALKESVCALWGVDESQSAVQSEHQTAQLTG
ncbi:LysR family transcriptional regulator [Marinobacterium zhoushanense]|uniref:LysR family transcriptional regulator n=1 Tax=Marinobacterium zhoushanense TaxID=1679163 RepID=A0ABQ1KMS0_9GAMM|nr:LysR family transcriptional regulator [Marinobacterium zhoushanense]GGC01629.1 LysR family transcriptional regulator [Marinobacterium zhoushanense]